ncbi:MAG: 6,7-dimethyl-8-ribityllumazine synthase [Thermoplasmata archaeon]|nr:6,7-dimethyl-8-ribityllumazine synthase [Thermoplasmata archaeon]
MKRDKEEEIRMGIVVSEFNYDITMSMLELAKEHARFLGVDVVKVVKVPGVFDIPFALKKLLQDIGIDVAVVLGSVIEGETEHDEVIMQQATRKIMDLSLEYEKPVGLGITGHGMNRLQAEERIERAKQAVEAAVKLYRASH